MLLREFSKETMRVCIYDSRRAMGLGAAEEAVAYVKDLLSRKEEVNIIFAAAPSQNEFLEAVASSDIDWSRVNAFHMDEYIGLPKEAPQGFGNFLRRAIFEKVNFRTVSYLNGNAEDIEAECERYTALLEEYPLDIACIGIGENGHIAFNDPHVADFNDPKLVKVVDLDDRCRQQQVNDGCFAEFDLVPKNALTLTVPSIFNAGYIACVVPAATKAEAVKNTVEGQIGEYCPATVIRNHKDATLYLDPDSASLLS